MTNNEVANKRAEEEARHNAEAERQGRVTQDEVEKHNRETERQGRVKNILTGAKVAADSIGGIARTVLNDPSWYRTNDQVLKDAANISFAAAVGAPLVEKLAESQSGDFVPGIMAFITEPCYGDSRDKTSSLNIAAQQLYTYVRHYNSGHSNYEPQDLMLYILAMDQLYMFHAFCQRLYGLSSVASQQNRYINDAVVTACGVSAEDLRFNGTLFRGWLNRFALRVNALAVPDKFNMFKRHSWMYSNVYCDAPTPKGQMYLFTPGHFLKFSHTAFEMKGGLLATTMPRNNMSVERLMQFGESLLQEVMGDEDIGIIAGDIKKAFKDSALFALPMVKEEYQVAPVYAPEVLSQIQNLRIAPFVDAKHSCDVIQYSDEVATGGHNILWTTYVADVAADGKLFADASTKLHYGYDNKLNLNVTNVTPDDVMVATRLHLGSVKWSKLPGTTDTTVPGIACGTEVISNIVVYQYSLERSASLGVHTVLKSFDVGRLALHMDNDPATTLSRAQMITDRLRLQATFDWAPPALVLIVSVDKSIQNAYWFADWNNYAEVPSNVMDNLHDAALLGLLAVPGYN